MRQLMVWGIRAVVPRHRIGVALVAFNEAEQVFMMRHVFHPTAPWGVPGGWLGRGESPAEAALRELKEETGLTAVLGPATYTIYDENPPHIGIVFLGQLQPGPITLSAEIMEVAWFSLDDLPEKMLPHMRQAIHSTITYHRLLRRS